MDAQEVVAREHDYVVGVYGRAPFVLERGQGSTVYDTEGKTIFSETSEKDKRSVYFIAEKTGEHSSRFTLEIYFQPNIIKQALFNRLEKKKKEKELLQSLERLDKVLKEMIVPLEF